MKRILVSSSSIVSVGYDAETETLEIEYVGGGVYQYFDVTRAVHEGLMASESLGRFVNTKVKDHYRYVRVSDSKEVQVKGSSGASAQVKRAEVTSKPLTKRPARLAVGLVNFA